MERGSDAGRQRIAVVVDRFAKQPDQDGGLSSDRTTTNMARVRGRCLATGNGPTQLTESVWPRPVSVAAGSQRHERAGWNGPAPLPPLLAAGSNALAPYGRGKGRDTPRHRAALTPAATGLAIAVALAVAGLSLQWRAGASLLKGSVMGSY